MLTTVQAPNERLRVQTHILKGLCLFCVLTGMFAIPSQDSHSAGVVYLLSGVVFWLSWRLLSYYGCLCNQCLHVALIYTVLQDMARRLQNGVGEGYFSAGGIVKMGHLVLAIVCIYFNFVAYRDFKHLAMQIDDFQRRPLPQP